MAWQLLKEVGIEGPADPHRAGMSPGINPMTGLPHEAHEEHVDEQLNEALEEEARLRNLPTDASELPPPPGPKDTMRIMPPRTDDFSGLPPNMQDYARQLSARRGRPPQGTSVQNPDDVLRSMNPIELAMDALQKRTPRSYRGEGGEQFLSHAMTAGADTPEDISQEDWQENLDIMTDGTDREAYPTPNNMNIPSDIPIDDPARHQLLDMARQAALEEGMEEPEIDEGEDLDDEDEWSGPGRGAVGGDAFQHRTFSLQDPVSRGPSL